MKRIVNHKGQSAPLWLWRVVASVTLPFMLLYAFFSTLCSEMHSAFRYAANDVSSEIDSFRRLWRGDAR